MKKLSVYFSLTIVTLGLSYCDDNATSKSPVEANNCIGRSWEVYKGDTINRVDCNNKKQGMWVKHANSRLHDSIFGQADTLFFRDDKIVFQKESI